MESESESFLSENRLKEYLRYMTYPEQMHNYLAFKNFYLFLLIFIMRVVYGTFRQIHLLGTLQVSKKQKYMLIGLFAIQNFSYHLAGNVLRKTCQAGPKIRCHALRISQCS